jgi:hypothetical protein
MGQHVLASVELDILGFSMNVTFTCLEAMEIYPYARQALNI